MGHPIIPMPCQNSTSMSSCRAYVRKGGITNGKIVEESKKLMAIDTTMVRAFRFVIGVFINQGSQFLGHVSFDHLFVVCPKPIVSNKET